MTTRSSDFLPILIGAGVGAVMGYLLFTESGYHTHRRANRWLDQVDSDVRRLRIIARNARAGLDEPSVGDGRFSE